MIDRTHMVIHHNISSIFSGGLPITAFCSSKMIGRSIRIGFSVIKAISSSSLMSSREIANSLKQDSLVLKISEGPKLSFFRMLFISDGVGGFLR